MDWRKTRKHANRRHKKRSTEKKSRAEFRISRISKQEGIEKLTLSPLTQQVLECRIGINITPEEPWIFIPKEKILENIELHDNSSEFLPLKSEIESYPDDKILIGCYGHAQDTPEVFLICISPDTVQFTLDALQAQEVARHQKIIDSIEKVSGFWESLGSEEEVEENMPLVLRQPFQVYLTSETATFFIRSKFGFRFVQDCPDGYTELTAPRQSFRNVFKKRMHAEAQCSPLKRNAITQTIIEPVMNRGTHTSHALKPLQLPKGAYQRFISRIDDTYILDLLETNYYMDLCGSDYRFKGALCMQLFKFPLYILSLQDIFTCRGKRVSCVSWNAMRSGLIAASYVKHPFSMILNKAYPLNSSDTVYEDHLILVWSYTDNIKPQLYLHSSREVTFVSFCSHNANIVVAGCENGQIVVWDITGRLERAGRTKILTRQQQEHHLILEHYMKWMKNPPEVQHVYPIIISKIEETHLSPVSYIEWLPPDQYITKNGKYEKKKPRDVQMQFLSCNTESGCIDIWDIGIPEEATIETKKKRIIRLNQVPEALTKYVSPLKVLKKNFIPVFRIFASNPDNRKPLVISKLLHKQPDINYRAINPETQDNIFKRTYYERIIEKDDEISEQEFICATEFGEVRSIQWDGFDYDQGCLVNSIPGSVSSLKVYHDGPIVCCMESPIIKDLFLTIGGRVFALWNAKNLQVPIFWRKNAQRYVAGGWLTTQPFQIGLSRYDNFKEIWDLMEDSKKALKIVKGKGRAGDGFFDDFGRMHVKKGTFVETNIAGEIKIYSVSNNFRNIADEEFETVIAYLEDLEYRRELLMKWTSAIKTKFNQLETKEEEETPIIVQAEAEEHRKSSIRKSLHLERNKWQAKEEAFMREVLLANKNMKMDQLIKNSELLRQAEELRKKHAVEFAEQLKNKDKNLQNWRKKLIPEQQFIVKKKITVSFPKDMSEYMKQSYLQNYKEVEDVATHFVKHHVYNYYYSWAEIHKRARASWSRKNSSQKEINLPKPVEYQRSSMLPHNL